ncbi:hypothetical protein [Nocardia carnea]|nr:hypothetical protein [Nocardia carnea]
MTTVRHGVATTTRTTRGRVVTADHPQATLTAARAEAAELMPAR